MKTMAQVIEKIGAGEGNRTLVISLEGCCSTIELHPRRTTLTARLRCYATSAGQPSLRKAYQPQRCRREAGGRGRTRTCEGVSQRIYSPTRRFDITIEFPFMSRPCRADWFPKYSKDLSQRADCVSAGIHASKARSAAASSSRSSPRGNRWPYRSIVSVMVEWPINSCTTLAVRPRPPRSRGLMHQLAK